MGLFDWIKKKAQPQMEQKNEDVYVAKPHVYSDNDGNLFGTFALTEGTLTYLPADPKARYKIDGEKIPRWGLTLVSTTEDCVIGELDYDMALEKMKKHCVREEERGLLIKGLSLDELKEMLS